MKVTDEMVDRFLNWPLPESVCSDPCATQQGYPNRMTDEGRVAASANIGFAIATIKAFTTKPGVNLSQIHEALAKLDEALEIVSTYERTEKYRQSCGAAKDEER